MAQAVTPKGRPPADHVLERFAEAAPHVPPGVRRVLEVLHGAGHAAYLAGGCVRDVLIGRLAEDFDVATSARPEAVQQLFSHVVPTGIQHGTVTVVLGKGPHDKLEVTTFRGEGEYHDGRRPHEVFFLDDIDEDLARRDFTVNAIAWDPTRGEVRDPFGGASDLARRRIRAVGVARDRFLEDGLRPMRAVRFASTLGFGLDARTHEAIGQTLDVFRKVAAERVRDELIKLLVRSPRPSRGVELLADTGLLGVFAPELLEGRGLRQNRYHRFDVWDHTMHVLDHSAPTLVVRLCALLHDVAKPRCAAEISPGEHTFFKHEFVGADLAGLMLERLRFPRKVIDAVVHQVREHNWHYTSEWNDGTVRRHLARVGVDALDDFFALREADLKGRGRRVKEALANLAQLRERFDAERVQQHALSIKDLAVGGQDVMAALGQGPGPHVGEALRALLQHVLDRPDDNSRDLLLALVRQGLPPAPPA